MIYKKGACLEEINNLIDNKDLDNHYDESLKNIIKDDELTQKYKFHTFAQGSLYVYSLLQKCEELEKEIHSCITDIKKVKPCLFSKTTKLKNHLNMHYELSSVKNELKSEIKDFQKYSVTLRACVPENSIDMLIEEYKKIESELLLMFNLADMKIREILSSRITATNIGLSVIAILVAIIISA